MPCDNLYLFSYMKDPLLLEHFANMNKPVGWFMVFNATFNNSSVISWRSVLLVEETGVPEENHRPVVNQWQTLVVIGTDCIGSYKSNYHTITTTTAPVNKPNMKAIRDICWNKIHQYWLIKESADTQIILTRFVTHHIKEKEHSRHPDNIDTPHHTPR
jgi:hypothetical protein